MMAAYTAGIRMVYFVHDEKYLIANTFKTFLGEELEDTWFEGYSNVEKVILVYVKNIPLIFAAQKHQVLIYGHHDNGLRLINKIKEANHISEINYFVNSNAFVMITLEENRNSTVKVMPFTIDINNIGMTKCTF